MTDRTAEPDPTPDPNDPSVSMLDHALAYARAGLHVFPLHRVVDGRCSCGRDCGSPGKHPRTRRGALDATADLGEIMAWGDLWTDANIGIALAPSGLWVLDIDYRPDTDRDGLPWLRYRTDRHGKIRTATARTGSGGLHLYFRGSAALPVEHVPQTQNRLDVGVDTVSRGYAIAPPSLHQSGSHYAWLDGAGLDAIAEPPDWLVGQIHGLAPPPEPTPEPPPRPPSDLDPAVRQERLGRARAYAQSAAPAISGASGHTQTFSVAQHLLGFGLDSYDVLDILRADYNPRCQPAWSEKELARKVDQAASKSKVHRTKDPGLLESAANAPRIDVSALVRAVTPSMVSAEGESTGWSEVGGDLRDPTLYPEGDESIRLTHPALEYDEIPPGIPLGLVEDAPRGIRLVARWISSCAIKPTPAGALGAAITLLGAAIGTRWRTPTGSRANLYAVHVAPTGAGKDNQRTLCQRVLTHPEVAAYGAARILGSEEIGSDQGLIAEVSQHRVRLYLLDELGRSLQRWTGRGAGSWEQGIKHSLTKLYSASNYMGRAVMSSEPIQIRDPHVSIWGCSTPGQWYDSLEAGSVEDGFLNRFLVFEDQSHPPRTIGPDFASRSREVPRDVIDLIRAIFEVSPGGGDLAAIDVSSLDPSSSPTVPATEGAWTLLQQIQHEYDARIGTPTGPLWVRAHLAAFKIATIAAVAESPDAPEIDESHARYAIALVDRLIGRQAQQAELRIAGSGREAKLQLVLRAVRGEGGAATRAIISRRTPNLAKRERDELLEELVSNGQLEVHNRHFLLPFGSDDA